jgi:tetratricopeptide (TPR) repeat protein
VISRLVPPDRDGYPYYRLASIHLMQGNVDQARREAEQAIGMFAARDADFQYSSEAMLVLGEVLEASGDLDGARRQFQQSLDTRVKLGDSVLIAASRTSLASLSIEEGRASEGEAAVRESLPEFEKEKDIVDLVQGYVHLSRALLMLGKVEDARAAIRHAGDLARSNPDPAVKYPVTIQEARVSSAVMDPPAAPAEERDGIAEARRQLQSVIAGGRRLGYFSLACEARLALGELEMHGDSSVGRSDLESLARETHARGLELISRKASSVLTQGARRAS